MDGARAAPECRRRMSCALLRGALLNCWPWLAELQHWWLDKDVRSMLIKFADDTESLGRTPCWTQDMRGDGGDGQGLPRYRNQSHENPAEGTWPHSGLCERAGPGTSSGVWEGAWCAERAHPIRGCPTPVRGIDRVTATATDQLVQVPHLEH